jgi:DNA-binding transcriptional ArsR family regulator
MVSYPDALAPPSEDDVDRLFHALADATRRDILRRTLASESSVTGLAHEYDMSFAAVRKHVGVLEQAGLVSKLRRGREQIVRGEPTGVKRVNDLMDAYEVIWRHRLVTLDTILDQQP